MKLGWAFFGLAVVAMVAYALNRGVYVGSNIDAAEFGGRILFSTQCRYLFPTGVKETFGGSVGNSLEEAKAKGWFCPLFMPTR